MDIQCYAFNVNKEPEIKESLNIQDSKTFYYRKGLDLEYQLHFDFEYLIDFIEMRRKDYFYREIKSLNRLERLQKDLDRETGLFSVLFIEQK